MESLAAALGTSAAALKLLISLLLTYPIAFVYQKHFYSLSPTAQHVYFTATGLLLTVFNFHIEVWHQLVCILVQYLLLLSFRNRTSVLVFISFAFQLTYLLLGYKWFESDMYDITWTLPHCVLMLRLVAVAFDVHDGETQVPSLLQLFGHCFFPCAVLVGPQFSMEKYLGLVERREKDVNLNEVRPPLREALTRMGLGLFYAGVYIVGTLWFPSGYGADPELLEQPFWKKIFLLAMWGKVNITKYLSCWLIAEGSCIISGLAFNGFDETTNEPTWTGCRNIHLIAYETATEYSDMIYCFNVNTNAWVSKYVFKRLKFLGNKRISHFVALLFLAAWHGLHLGYYVTFFNEFLLVTVERDFYAFVSRSPYKIPFTLPKILSFPLKTTWMWIGLSYAATPFILLKTKKWLPLYWNQYFYLHVLFLSYVAFGKPVLKKLLNIRSQKREEQLVANGTKKDD